jgi:hypothetical protein
MTTNLTAYQKQSLYKGLGLFIEAFRPYVVELLRGAYGEHWADAFVEALGSGQRDTWQQGLRAGSDPATLVDFQYLNSFAYKYRELLKPDFGRQAGSLPNWLKEVAEVRHKIAHFQTGLEADEADKAWIHLKAVARALKQPELEAELQRLRSLPAEPVLVAPPVAVADAGGPRAWFRVVTPALDIQQGRLDESIFAANVAEVALGNGRELYRDADTFFAKTYFTQGLRTVARRVVEGLNGGGDGENRVISLQTGFGGGKTHTLISLWHLAHSGERLPAAVAQELLAAGSYQAPLLPNFAEARVAVFTNTTNNVAEGRQVPEGPRLYTLWGELAWQLGGPAAYELVRASDEERISPGGTFQRVLELVGEQHGPALLLLDELADYCVQAAGKVVGASTLADQTISFMQALTEAVAAAPRAVLVVTLPASDTEVSTTAEAGQILSRLQGRVGRVGADTQPVRDDEIFEVVRRRLFEDLGPEAVRLAVAGQYHDYYQMLFSDLPGPALQAGYRRLMEKAYPFHPELIEVFRQRWASHHDFQRTRGALRLLAAILADLWQRRDSLPGKQWLVHTSDVRLENLDPLTGELKKLYGSGYEAVLTADVAGSAANARKLDEAKKEYGDRHLAQGLATTILLNSFGGDGSNKGLSVRELKLNVVRPADELNHNTINSVLDELEASAHYLYYAAGGDGKRYWFHTKPNVNILINQAKNDITEASADSEIQRRVQEKAGRVAGFRLLLNPASDDVPEQQQLTLVLLPLTQRLRADGTLDKATARRIEAIATKRGSGERIYRNTLLFLLASDLGAAKLNAAVRDYLACEKIRQDYNSQLEPEQRLDLKRRSDECQAQVEKALIAAYSVVAKHRVKDGTQLFNFKEFAATFDQQLAANLPALLEADEHQLLLRKGVGLGTLRQHGLLPEAARPLRAKDVYEAFLRFDDKPLIWSQAVVQESLLRFCNSGDFGIAASDDGRDLKTVWLKQTVPLFEVTEPSYWLIEKARAAEFLAQVPAGPAAPVAEAVIVQSSQSASEPPAAASAVGEPRVFRAVTVSGQVPVENYTQLFASFIRPLIDNRVEITVSIKGRSTTAKPLTENSAEYKIIKESARQLGLRLEED